MKVLVDTPVWSEALRRKPQRSNNTVLRLRTLIEENRVVLIGPIRQEILSGIRDFSQYEHLRKDLEAFPDHPIQTTDYETAAAYFNRCRGLGIQGSNTDFLICAVAVRHNYLVFTLDNDFQGYSRALRIKLFLRGP